MERVIILSNIIEVLGKGAKLLNVLLKLCLISFY